MNCFEPNPQQPCVEKCAHPLARGGLPSYSPFLSFAAQKCPGQCGPGTGHPCGRIKKARTAFTRMGIRESQPAHAWSQSSLFFSHRTHFSDSQAVQGGLAAVTPQGPPLRTSRQEAAHGPDGAPRGAVLRDPGRLRGCTSQAATAAFAVERVQASNRRL